MLEGIDGAGKGIIGRELLKLLNVDIKDGIPGSTDGRPGMTANTNIFDLDQYFNEHHSYPEIADWENFQVISDSEPTYAPVGRYIREELTNKDKSYSSAALAQAYALDRQILYEKLILPALERGKIVIQSRGFVSSIVYQNLGANNNGLPLDEILNLPGNQFALQRVPDYVIIPKLNDAKQAFERLLSREKQDNSIFEKLDFLTKAQVKYQGDELREFLENRGSQVIYLDTSDTLEATITRTKEFFDKYLKDRI